MCNHLANLYTPMHEAVEELQTRRVANTQQPADDLERLLASQPYAVLFRQIATPHFEMHRFAALASEAGLSPLVLEFHRDKFVDCNPDKYALARLRFHSGKGRNGGDRIQALTVIDMTAANGRSFHEVRTHSGQPFIDFHHDLLAACPSLLKVERCDISDWFYAHEPTARDYYCDFLALFIRHGVLFESFLPTGRDELFTTEIVFPAFEAAHTRHGLRPLICRLDPPDSEGAPYWLQYPPELLPIAQAQLIAGDGFCSSTQNARRI